MLLWFRSWHQRHCVRGQGNSVGRVTVVFVPKLFRWTKRRCHLVYPGVFGFDWDKVTGRQTGQWPIPSELGIWLNLSALHGPKLRCNRSSRRLLRSHCWSNKKWQIVSDTSFLCNGFDVWEWCSYSKFAFCEGIFDASFLGTLSNGYEKQGSETSTVRVWQDARRTW